MINKVFREYATRVSFNLSLSRNQISHLAAIAAVENVHAGWLERSNLKDQAIAEIGGNPRLFIVGNRSLVGMGLIEDNPLWVAFEKAYEVAKAHGKPEPPEPLVNLYILTDAGRSVVSLLRIAGLIPQAAANTDRRAVKRRA